MPEWVVNSIVIGLAIWPLIQIQRWIHQHVQGLGLLITDNPQAAVLIYYLAFAPGVFLHELSQYAVAQLLRVKVKEFRLWPQEQKGDVIRLGLVEIDQRRTDNVRATIVGVTPFVAGVTAIAIIGNWRYNFEPLFTAFGTGDPQNVVEGFKIFMSAPDFWLWFYLLFAIANTMLPEEHDFIDWRIIAGPIVGLGIFLIILNLNILVVAWLEGPYTFITQAVSFSLLAALAIDFFMWAVLSLAEEGISRLLDRELEYE